MHPYKRLEQATAARVALEREWKKDTEEYREAVAAENLAYDKLHDPRPGDDAEVVDLGDARPIPTRRDGVFHGDLPKWPMKDATFAACYGMSAEHIMKRVMEGNK